MNEVIEIKNASKSYSTKKEKINVLNKINLTFEKGKLYAIMGHSGCGKSTLINALGLIDQFDSGEYLLNKAVINNLNDKDLSQLRMKNIGFIHQEFYLIEEMKAYENVILPLLLNKDIKNKKETALKLLKKVGLENRVEHFPNELSGGEQQRVAIARALVNNPDLILADEPTGNLDETNEKQIFEMLESIAKKGKCVIVVSHSPEIKKYADKVLLLKNGKIEALNE